MSGTSFLSSPSHLLVTVCIFGRDTESLAAWPCWVGCMRDPCELEWRYHPFSWCLKRAFIHICLTSAKRLLSASLLLPRLTLLSNVFPITPGFSWTPVTKNLFPSALGRVNTLFCLDTAHTLTLIMGHTALVQKFPRSIWFFDKFSCL